VSVTTDGFITNIDNLEKLVSGNYLMKEFKIIRSNLSGDNLGLEVKGSGLGVFS
jgi:hypothetical protein